MSETDRCEINELDKLLAECKAKVDLDRTIGFKRDDLTEEQTLIETLAEKNSRVVKLLEELVKRQKRDDRSAKFVTLLNKCTTRAGLAIGAGLLATITYLSQMYITALFEKTPAELRQEQLIIQMLEDEFGPMEPVPQKK